MSPAEAEPLLSVRHGTATDSGRVRAGNEDSFLADPELGLYAVADGLGGHRAGEVASRLAIDRIHASVRDAPDGDAPARVLTRALLDAHDEVKQAAVGRPERAGMGTTVVLAWITAPDRVWLANVGDSRAYRLRGGVLAHLTEDDTLLEELRRSGTLPEDPAERPPRGQLTQALGPSIAINPHLGDHPLQPGDRILLCSDGLTDMLTDAEIRFLLAAAADIQQACDALVDAANLRGGLDNVTVVLLQAMPAEIEQA